MNGDRNSKIDFQKYSSFQAMPIPSRTGTEVNNLCQILPNQSSAVVLSPNSVRVFTHGGLLESSIQVSDNIQFTCASLIGPATNRKDTSSSFSNYLICGTDQHEAVLHDLSQSTINGRGNTFFMKYSLRSPSIKTLCNGFVVALAGQDGG